MRVKTSALLINLLLDSFQHLLVSHLLPFPLPNCLEAAVNKFHKERLSHRLPHQPSFVFTAVQFCQKCFEMRIG